MCCEDDIQWEVRLNASFKQDMFSLNTNVDIWDANNAECTLEYYHGVCVNFFPEYELIMKQVLLNLFKRMIFA